MFVDLKKMYDFLYDNSYVNKIVNIRKEAIKEMDQIVEKEDLVKEKSQEDDNISNTSDETPS